MPSHLLHTSVLSQNTSKGCIQSPASCCSHKRRICCAVSLGDPLLLRVARGEDAERTPVWLMRQAGRYMAEFRKYSDTIGFRERSENASIAVELSLQPWRAFRPDGVIMFSDILTPLPALGIEFDVIRGRGPIIEQPIRSDERLAEVRPLTDPASHLPFVAETLHALRAEVGDAATTLGFIGAPWTLAAYAVEGRADRNCQQTKTMMLWRPDMLHSLLDRLADALIVYALFQIQSGAQVVQLFESWAHHLNAAQFREFALPYVQRIIREVKAQQPDVPLIYHANGGADKMGAMRGCGADVVGLDWHSSIPEARAALGEAQVLQGNVDPMIFFGPEDAIRSAVSACLQEAGSRGHILNVGHGVIQGTPEESVKLFCQLAHESTSDSRREPALV